MNSIIFKNRFLDNYAYHIEITKFCSGSGYYFGFQYQTYIPYTEDTHQILFVSANSFESYFVHMKSPPTYSQTIRQTDRQTYRRTELFFCLFCLLRHTKHEHSSKGENFFFHSCDSNTFSFYILRMLWDSKNTYQIFFNKRKKKIERKKNRG